MKSPCEKCGLYQQCNTPFMEGVGPPGAEIALVLDTPGAPSDALGVPFSGDAGRLLSGVLTEAGIPVRHLYITHAVRCQPQKKAPTVAQAKKCSQFLLEELGKLPNLKRVVTLGAHPLKSVAGAGYAVSKCRGTIINVDLNGRSIEVLPTWSPGFVFRNESAEPELRSDLLKIRQSEVTVDIEKRNYVSVDTSATRGEFLDALGKLTGDDWAAFDIESTGLDPWASDANVVCLSVAFSTDPETAYAIPVIHTDFPHTPEFVRAQSDVIRKLLTHECRKVTHNGKFDVKYLQANLDMPVPNHWYWDTRTAAHILDENRAANQGNSLKALALVYTDLGDYSKAIKDEGAIESLYSTTWHTVKTYACADAEATLRIALAQHEEAEREGMVDLISGLEMQKTLMCLHMENAGVDIDWGRLPTVIKQMEDRLAEYEDSLRKTPEVIRLEQDTHKEKNAKKLHDALVRNGLQPDPSLWDEEQQEKAAKVMKRNGEIPIHRCRFNPNSPAQKARLLFDYLRIRSAVTTDSGTPSVSAKAMIQIRPNLNEYQAGIVDKLELIAKVSKIKSTYLDPMESFRGRDGRIRSDYQTSTTVTGRLSSRSPNMQNIPRASSEETGSSEVKRLMIAPPGYVLVASDFAQIEMRLAAVLSQDHKMIDLINDGDIHKYLASKALRVPEEKIDKETRTIAKRVNFGALYGISAQGLVGQGMTLDVADTFLKTFWAEFSTFAKWSAETVHLARRQGFVEGLFGHRRRLPRINSAESADRAEAERQAVNFPIQNAAATITNIAGILLTQVAAAHKAEIIMQVHDSLISRVPEDCLNDYLPVKKQTMQVDAVPAYLREPGLRFDKLVPLEADCQVGHNLYEMEEVDW